MRSSQTAILIVTAGCATTTPGPSFPPVVKTPDIQVHWCERREADCFWCTEVTWPSSRPCESPDCNGLCFETNQGRSCLQYERVCGAGSANRKPPPIGACGVTCGDADGDGNYDRCLERLSCPTRHAETQFSTHYAVRHPIELYESLCAPLPEEVRKHIDRAGQPADCDAAPLYWVIAPATMKHASDATGPGLCYGVVEDEGEPTELEACGKHHCQTLRYCDGREQPEHCTVYAECRDGHFVPVRLGW